MRSTWVAAKTPNRCPVAPVTNPGLLGRVPYPPLAFVVQLRPVSFSEKREDVLKANPSLLEAGRHQQRLSPWDGQRPIDRRSSQARHQRRFAVPAGNRQRGLRNTVPKRALHKASLPWEQREWLARKPSLGDCQAL